MKHQKVVIDTGPPERRSHNKVVVEQGANMRARLRIVDQTTLDRLLHERKISLDQHTAGDHLYRDMIRAGYLLSARWLDDKGTGSQSQGISHDRATALLKMGLAKAWLFSGVGRRCTDWLFGVVLGERQVVDDQLPWVRQGLDKYQGFDSWWHGRDTNVPLPTLLRELPRKVQLSRPFHHEVR